MAITNYDILTGLTVDHVQKNIGSLQSQIEKYPELKELVDPIVAYGAEQAYASYGSADAQLGRYLTVFIWQISGDDLSELPRG